MRYNPTPYRPREGERYVVELVRPARRPGGPVRFAGFGAMPTAPNNDAPDDRGIPEAPIVDCGVAGEYVPRMRRRRRPDGTRARYAPEQAEHTRTRHATVLQEQAARATVHEALARGSLTDRGRCIRVVPTGTGALRTIPDKGRVLRWASAEDLAQALACGVDLF